MFAAPARSLREYDDRVHGRLGLLAGSALALVGLAIAIFPLVSVWRVSGQLLDELPVVDGVDSVDSRRHVSALTDPKFILAERMYETATVEEVREALEAGGYQRIAHEDEIWFGRECCGTYDAVWVSITEAPGRPGNVTALVTTADKDVRTASQLFAALGLLLLLPGVAVTASNLNRTNRQEPRVADEVPEPIG